MAYPGGKGAEGVAQTIINQQPPHDVYVEPFLGGGAILRIKRPAALNIGIDLDPSTIDRFNGAAISGLELICDNAIHWLDRLRFNEGNFIGKRVLIYCDPPYMMATRRNWAKMYRFEMTDLQHSAMLGFLVHSPHMVQISGYDSLMYQTWLKDWRCVEYQAATRHGMRTECLWMNYPEPEQLHDYRFLGRDYRERENIRRKAQRWVSRLTSLPRLERLAIYGEIASGIGNSKGAAAPNLPDRALAGGIGSSADGTRPQDPTGENGGAGHRSADTGKNAGTRVLRLGTSRKLDRRPRASAEKRVRDLTDRLSAGTEVVR